MTTPEKVPTRQTATGEHRTFIQHYGSTVLGQGAVLAIGVLTGILSARLLGPVGRGEFAAIIIWPMGIGTLFLCGIHQAAVFNLGRRLFTVSEIVTSTAVVALVQSVLTIIFGLSIIPIVFARYSQTARDLEVIFVLFIPAWFVTAYMGSLFQGQQDLLRFNIIRLLPPLTNVIGLAGMYFIHSRSLRWAIFSVLAGYAITAALGASMIWSKLRPGFKWNPKTIPRLINYGYRTQATTLASYFNQRIDQLVLSLFVPPEQLGLYAVAVTLATAVTVFPAAVGIVTFSRGIGQHSDDAKALIGRSFRASLIWLAVCCGMLYMLCPFLIRLVFGAAFEGSITACRILLPGAMMIGLNQVLYNGASALGRPGLPSIAEGVSMALTAIGLYLLVPHYGYIGAAYISSLAYTLSFLIMLGLGHWKLGINPRILLLGELSQFRFPF